MRLIIFLSFLFSGLGVAHAQDAASVSSPEVLFEDAALADRERRYEDAIALYEQAATQASPERKGYIIYQLAMIEEKRARPAQALELLSKHWTAVSTSPLVSDLDLFVARLERQVRPAKGSPALVAEPATGVRVSASDRERRNAMRGPWVTMGGGFLMSVAGGALILGSRQEEALINRYKQDCQTDPSLCDGVDLDQAARRANLKFYGGIGAAGLGVATLTGGIIWFVKRKKELDSDRRATRSVDLFPLHTTVAGRSYQGLGVSVSF